MRIEICGVGVDAVTSEEALAAIDRAVEERRAGTLARPLAVFSANVDMLVKAARDPVFAADLARADLLLADGVPLLWMARALGARLPERVAGSDLVPRLATWAAPRGHALFLVGGAPGVADAAAARLAAAAPGLRIAGTVAPAPGFERSPEERGALARAIAAARPDVVLVGLGAPRQERFILEERDRLPAAAFLAVGGTFDLLAGRRRRAPRLLQRAGLEWSWRLAQEPVRLGRRYLVDDAAIVPLFARAIARRYLGRASSR